MGNNKNKVLSHASRGKYKKVNPYMKWSNKHAKSDRDQEFILKSSRIVNLEQLESMLNCIAVHTSTCQPCINGTDMLISLIGEKYSNGLASVLTAQCNGCGEQLSFPTSPKVSCFGGAKRWECNLAAVWGGGFSSLRESMSVLGIPIMTKRTFIKTERSLGAWWWKALEESMTTAGQEEKPRAW